MLLVVEIFNRIFLFRCRLNPIKRRNGMWKWTLILHDIMKSNDTCTILAKDDLINPF